MTIAAASVATKCPLRATYPGPLAYEILSLYTILSEKERKSVSKNHRAVMPADIEPRRRDAQ